jgi:hypothetical protein
MATEALKSNPIVNLDSFPVIANTTGEGDDGNMRCVCGHVAATAGVTSPSTYRMVRLPTNAKIKHVLLRSVAQGGSSAVDVDIAFSDSTVDGTQQSLAGGVVQITGPADNKLFGSATSLVSAVGTATAAYADITFGNTFTTDMVNIPLWQVLVNLGATQFTADPGGFFDIFLKSTATITNGGDIAVEVQYCV